MYYDILVWEYFSCLILCCCLFSWISFWIGIDCFGTIIFFIFCLNIGYYIHHCSWLLQVHYEFPLYYGSIQLEIWIRMILVCCTCVVSVVAIESKNNWGQNTNGRDFEWKSTMEKRLFDWCVCYVSNEYHNHVIILIDLRRTIAFN